MNREQITCILVGIFILAGMFLCVPVPVHMISLYLYTGDTDAGMNMMTFYEFIPDGWLRVINYGFFFWQCFFLTVIVFCLFFVFRKDIKKPISEIKKLKRSFSLVLITSSVLIFFIGLVDASLGNVFWYFELVLIVAGLLGFLATLNIIDVYVANQRISRLLMAVLISCAVLTICMMASYFGHRYSPNKFQITPNMWRLLGGLAVLGVWVCYAIDQFIINTGKIRGNA